MDDLAKGYVHAQKLVGAKGIIPPAKDASPEDWGKFYNQLGRPEKPDAYRIPAELPKEVQIDEQVLGQFRGAAHEAGLTETQFAKLVRWQTALAAESAAAEAKAAVEAKAAAEAELRKEFGAAYDERIAMVRDMMTKHGGADVLKALDGAGLGSHPAIVKMFASVAKSLGTDEIVGGGSRKAFAMTPGEAQQQIGDLMRRREFADSLKDNRHPAYAENMALWTKLNQAAAGAE